MKNDMCPPHERRKCAALLLVGPGPPRANQWLPKRRTSENRRDLVLPGLNFHDAAGATLVKRLGPAAAVVDFHQTNAGTVVHSREQRGVKARRQRGGDAGLQLICRGQTSRGQFRRLSLVILPIVIPDEKRSVAVAQLQRWIGQ